jgi:glutamate synthase (NADPH/NADH) small chain
LPLVFRQTREPWLSEQGVELDDQERIIAPESGRFAFQSSSEKIFAGGDAVRGADLVVTAIAEGRQAAEAILDYLEV